MNKKFVWTIKHTIGSCLFCVLLLIISFFLDDNKFIRFSVSTLFASTGVVIAHVVRIKSGIKDNELSLSNKQMLFVFILSLLVILSIFLIKQFVADKSLAITFICVIALISGIYTLFYMKKHIKNKRNQIKL
jgi:phosphatidylglycerophosphate synthase